jgi:2-polyprenyl-6-methoxyphenol hydroxylase-like FAD-dependent oxidoreductase
MMETIDGVLVAGGGPVGLLTALKLARAGVPVTVLEAEAEVLNSPRAIAYQPPTTAALERLGLLDDVLKRSVKSPDVAFRRVDGSPLAILNWSVLKDTTPYDYMLLIGQDTLSRVIVSHLKRYAHVEIRWGHRVFGVSQNATSVTVSAATANGEVQIQAPWLAATDGARSPVRESLGIAFEGITWPERFVATNVFYDFHLHGYSRANFIVDPVDWAVIAQIDKTGLWRVCYGEDASLSETEIRARLPERFKRLLPGAPEPESYRVDLCNPYRVHQRAAARFREGRVLLAGDAAHATNPIGGLGLSTGVLDAERLGEVLAAVWLGKASEDLLDAYAADRRRVFLEVSSPIASENKRRISESDPAKRAQDEAGLAAVNADSALQFNILSGFEALNGRWFNERDHQSGRAD